MTASPYQMTPEQLRAEAKQMVDLLPPAPTWEWVNDVPTVPTGVEAEFASHWEARRHLELDLAELAAWDGHLLQEALGPSSDDPKGPWQLLLIGAAAACEQGNRLVGEVAIAVADRALFGAQVDPTRDWSQAHARHARQSEDPAESLRHAIALVPLLARRMGDQSDEVVEEATNRLARALAQATTLASEEHKSAEGRSATRDDPSATPAA
jgi:hypothetical protein